MAHPASVNETYLQHLRSAMSFSWRMLCGGVCCAVHGVFPFTMQRSGSKAVSELYQKMCISRSGTSVTRPDAGRNARDRTDP